LCPGFLDGSPAIGFDLLVQIELGGSTAGKGDVQVRLIKILGLAAISALAAMAFLGASTASATNNTVLCLKGEKLICPEGEKLENALIHMVLSSEPGEFGGVGKLLSSLATVLCLNVLVSAETLTLAVAPEKLLIHQHSFEPTGCGTNSTHTNCTITTEEQSLFLLLNENTEVGEGEELKVVEHATAEAMGGITHVVCTEVGIFKVKIDCKYAANGIKFLIHEGHLTAKETPVKIIEGSFFCPEKSTVDGLLELLPHFLGEGSEPKLGVGGAEDKIYVRS
jgi:hypothetical protein